MRPKTLSGILGGSLFASVLLMGCSGGGRHPQPDETSATEHRQANPPRPVAAVPLIDLPAALRLRLPQFSTQFGHPLPLPTGFLDPGKAVDEQSAAGHDSLALFQPRGLPLVVSFQAGTGVVQDVLLLGPDERVLMRQATLLPDAAGYLLLPVFQVRHPDQLLGLRVVPK